MDGYEATRIVFSRIQNLDPENASKIMGLLLLQDHGEKEMIRLAFGPETLIHSLILKAKIELGISLPSNSPINSPSTPPSPSPFLPTNQKITTSTPTITIPRQNSSSTTTWNANFSDFPSPDELISPSSGSAMNSNALPFYGNSNNGGGSDIIDEFQLQDQLAFLNDNVDSNMILPSYWSNGGGGVHRRSCSVSDVLGAGGVDDLNSGFGWRPCLYFARGYCKNGNSCRFIHGGLGDQSDGANSMVGSPSNNSKFETTMDQCHEILRSKSAVQQQQQRLAAASFPFSPKGMNLFLQQQQNDPQRAAAAAAALMMNEDMHKFSRSRIERNDFSNMVNPASRQIYLTFPADSTFREEDVSNYFSIYGPVQDVRIPYQQKRMFGFVTFVYPETVKIILAKGNPHFVCDARVLVKPYKEKGKVPDKYRKQQQQVERGEFSSSPCGTPTGLDSRDPFDLQLGARMLYNNTQDILWRKKMEEQADLQQAIELQSRRLMNLQLLDVKNKHHHRALSTGSPVPSPTHSPNLFHQNIVLPPFHNKTPDNVPQDKCSSPLPNISVAGALEKQTADGAAAVGGEENGNGKKSSHAEDGDLLGSLEHNLPDSPFASPTKGCGKYLTAFSKDASSSSSSSDNNNNNVVTPANLVPASTASLDMASFKSFNCQMPRFSSGHGGAIGMYSGSGGPTCPVGI